MQLPSGEILVTWFTSIVFGTDRETVWRHPEYKKELEKHDPAAVKEAKGYFLMRSTDDGKTWDVEHEILLSPSHNGDLGYPASTLLADGSILTVYYQQPAPGQKPCLMATKWRVLR